MNFWLKIVFPLLTFCMLPIVAIFKIFYVLYECLGSLCASRNSPDIHANKVKVVQDQVLKWNRNGRKNKMCTGRPSWECFNVRVPSYKTTSTKIYIDLGDIIQVDTVKQVVHVEPLMQMGKLSATLSKMGWIIPMLPEFDYLTVGGLINGTGVETSGHKYGFFQHICVGYEIVVADGRVVNCSKDENSDLFYSIPWSHGTLGFMTSATIMIIPATKYVKLEYIPCHSLDEAISVLQFQTYREYGNDYVEGIMFDQDKAVITVGTLTSEAESGKVNSIGRWYKPWFFKHVQSHLKKNPVLEYVEYIPIRDYLHRHTACAFWEIQPALIIGNNVIYRYLFGWILPIPFKFGKLILPKKVQNMGDNVHVLQDFVIPIEHLKEFLLFSHQEAQVYPMWLCPTKIMNVPGMCKPKSGKDEMFVDVGVYGIPKVKGYTLEESGRRFEALSLKYGGYQFLYAIVLLSREQFEIMLDHELYRKVRKQFHCEDAFPEVYDKICRTA